jgi:predicted secreted hydrolase
MVMRGWLLAVAIGGTVAAMPGAASGNASQCAAELEGAITTPADDAIHCVVDPATCVGETCACDPTLHSPYNHEWWYFTGHLVTLDGGRRLGFAEIVYSAIDLGSFLPLTWADHVLIDVGASAYRSAARETVIGLAPYVEGGYRFTFPGARIAGGDGFTTIRSRFIDQATGEAVAADLLLVSLKAPVEQRADGLVFYYSRERLLVLGAVEIAGKRHPVVGSAWFDHQFGPQRAAFLNVTTWSWFALQLDGLRELVVYDVGMNENETRPEYAGGVREGTFSDAHCNVTPLSRQDITITPLGSWSSPWMPPGWGDFACVYPMGWRIEVPRLGIDVEVQPSFLAQEIVVPEVEGIPLVGDRYWEGASVVSGTHRGRAFVEMMGFCPFSVGPY